MDKVRKFKWVADEKYRGVVTHDVPVPFFGVELDRKTTRVALGVSGAALATYGGKSHKGGRLLANCIEQLGTAVLGNITGQGEGAMGP